MSIPKSFRLLLALIVLAASLTPLQASAQSDFPFRLHNRSNGWTIAAFQTFQNGSWSSNWLDGLRIGPGENASMDWKSNAGDCTVRFRVSWVDYGAEEFRADFCKLRNLYMLNDGFRWD